MVDAISTWFEPDFDKEGIRVRVGHYLPKVVRRPFMSAMWECSEGFSFSKLEDYTPYYEYLHKMRDEKVLVVEPK